MRQIFHDLTFTDVVLHTTRHMCTLFTHDTTIPTYCTHAHAQCIPLYKLA